MTDKLLQQFRNAVYQSLLKRPDAVLDLIDALTVAGHVESPVALSEEAPFRRKFSMVYDILCHARIDFDRLLHTLVTFQPSDSELIAGYEVYALDATKNERPEAETLPACCSLKSQKDEPLVYGHKLPRWKTQTTYSRAGAAHRFTIFVAVGHTGQSTPSHWKRKGSSEWVSSSPESTVSRDQEG